MGFTPAQLPELRLLCTLPHVQRFSTVPGAPSLQPPCPNWMIPSPRPHEPCPISGCSRLSVAARFYCAIYNSVGESSEGGHMLPPGSGRAVLAAERVRRDPRSLFRSAPQLPELHRGCLGTQRLWVCKGSEQGAHC